MKDPPDRDGDLIHLIYREILEEDDWPALLDCMTREFDGTYSALVTQDTVSGVARVEAADGLPPERCAAYETYYGPRSTALNFVRGLRDGSVYSDSMYDDQAAYLGSLIYNEFFKPLKADHLLSLQISRDQFIRRSLVIRRPRSRGPYDESSRERLARLGAHVRSAERVRLRLGASELCQINVRGIVESLGIALFVTDADCRILHTSSLGEQMLRAGTLLSARRGRLQASGKLRTALATAVSECALSLDTTGKCTEQILSDESDDCGPSRIFVSALPWRVDGGVTRSAALLVVDAGNDTPCAEELEGLFHLTAAEARTVAAICRGETLTDHAFHAGISVLTARTLLKRALDKTGVHSQAALVSLVLRHMSPLRR